MSGIRLLITHLLDIFLGRYNFAGEVGGHHAYQASVVPEPSQRVFLPPRGRCQGVCMWEQFEVAEGFLQSCHTRWKHSFPSQDIPKSIPRVATKVSAVTASSTSGKMEVSMEGEEAGFKANIEVR